VATSTTRRRFEQLFNAVRAPAEAGGTTCYRPAGTVTTVAANLALEAAVRQGSGKVSLWPMRVVDRIDVRQPRDAETMRSSSPHGPGAGGAPPWLPPEHPCPSRCCRPLPCPPASPRERPGRPGGLARIADWVTSGDGGTPWHPGRRAGRRQPRPRPGRAPPPASHHRRRPGRSRATQAIRGHPRVRQGGSRAWRTVTVDPGTSLPIHQAGAAQLAGWLGGQRGRDPAAPRPRRSRRLTVTAVGHVRARR
jgi:hypothetical protein